MGQKLDIELRVSTTGSVLSWEIFLENTSSSSRVDHWIYNSGSKYYFRILGDYSIDDNALDVYVGCEGKIGGFTTCTVVIDNKVQDKKVICNNTDKDYAHQSYNITKT